MLSKERLQNLLTHVALGLVDPENALDQLLESETEGTDQMRSSPDQASNPQSGDASKDMLIGDLGFAQVDLNRLKRRGVGEVIFGQGKTKEQILDLLLYLSHHQGRALATRVSLESGLWIDQQLTELQTPDTSVNPSTLSSSPKRQWIYHQSARCFELKLPQSQPSQKGKGVIAVVSAGTSDGPVADEAECVLRFLGHDVDRINDVGVAGLHRLLNQLERLQSANVLVVCAGMEGALASVVAGLVDVPVIAVPTSVGYGANLQGLTTLLSMLNSCAAGVAVVNVDNGFGAAYLASQINRDRSV